MTDAEKREKVIRGLTECVKGFGPKACDECPYGVGDPRPCVFQLFRDALALLKEQEARVMTLEEIEDCDSAMWIEFKSSIYPGIYHDRHGKWLFITRKSQYWLGAEKHYADNYNKTWRCWTSRPMPEQMRETKWEGAKDE